MKRAVNLAIVVSAVACGFPDYSFPSQDGGGTSLDASGGDGPEGGTLAPFCSGHPTASFCADFDENPDVTFSWDKTEGRGDFSLSAFTDAPHSGARSLLSHTGRDNGSENPEGVLVHVARESVPSVTLDFEVRVEVVDGGNSAGALAAIHYGLRGAVVSLDASSAFFVASQNDSVEENLTPAVRLVARLHEWTHVQLHVETGSPGKVTLIVTRPGDAPVTLFDQAPLAAGSVSGVLSPGAPSLLLGSYFSPASAAGWTFAYDDVTLGLN